MALKVVMGTESGKTFQRETTQEEAEALRGRVLGEELSGETLGYSGVTFKISGGSDAQGFPMRKDIDGPRRKKILTPKSTGFKGKLRNKRFGGLRVKKSMAGNTISENTAQLNLKVVKGSDVLEKAFAQPEEGEESSQEE